jgi:hypothetical protein
MIETWIDDLVKVWEVSDGRSGQVYAYRLFERDEFPEDVPLDRPVALTFVDNVELMYSQGGPCVLIWSGTVEFNLTPDLNRKRIPQVLRYINRILVAAAGNMTLGGKVNYMLIDNQIRLVPLRYGNEAPHLGLEVQWKVKETIEGLVVQ